MEGLKPWVETRELSSNVNKNCLVPTANWTKAYGVLNWKSKHGDHFWPSLLFAVIQLLDWFVSPCWSVRTLFWAKRTKKENNSPKKGREGETLASVLTAAGCGLLRSSVEALWGTQKAVHGTVWVEVLTTHLCIWQTLTVQHSEWLERLKTVYSGLQKR